MLFQIVLSRVFFIIILLFINQKIFAEEYNLKFNYGLAKHDDSSFSSTNSNIKFDDEDTGYIISLSKKLNNLLGFEVAYYDLGETSISGNLNEAFTYEKGVYQFKNSGTISRNTIGYGVAGIITSPQQFFNTSGYFKLGFHNWKHEGTTDLLYGSIDTFKSHFYNTGYDLYSGLGVDYQILKNINLNFEYSYFSFNDSTFGQIIGKPITLLSMGIGISF